MSEKEIELFNEFKEFLIAVNNEEYSASDAKEMLDYFYDKLNEV